MRPLLCALTLFAAGCSSSPSTSSGVVEAAGLHNVRRVTDKLLTGSSPEGDAGFASLRDLGVRTVISVDGATPDVGRARRFGLRYVHLPIGYDGVPHDQALRIARAVRDLPGRVYLHCHHGKHRAPAAGAVVRLCLDATCPAERAVEEMRRAGTDPRYAGLYASPAGLRRPTAAELDAVPADFPEVASIPATAEAMVRIDTTWDRLKLVRAAGWRAPKDHPDLDPAHEALQLAEHYRELLRLPGSADRPEEYRGWVREAEADAARLEAALRGEPLVAAPAEAAYRASAAACTRCHATYRDVPRGR